MLRVGDESSLIVAAKRGEISAFNQLVQAYQESVYHTAFRVLGDAAMAESATHAAFLAAHRNLHVFDGGPFKLWLFRILIQCCSRAHDCVDRQSRRAVGKSSLSQPSRSLDAILQAGLDCLPLEERMTVILSDVLGLAREEVACIAETPLVTVQENLRRARYGLRAFFLAQPELASTRGRVTG